MNDPGPDVGVPPPGHRAPAATRLGPVRLQVADLGRSVDWYGRVLGLGVAEQDGATAGLAAAAGGSVLVELRERPGAAPVPRDGRLGLYHVAYLLPDRPSLGAFLRHLGELGVRAGGADHLVSEALYLQDPDGLGIEVYADRPRATWRAHGRELAMDSLALDAGGLLRAAQAVRWAGMPAGAVVGHVHLHVGDLDVAERFYHHGLGFDRMVWGYPGARFLAAGGYHHHLGLNTWARGGPAADGDARLLEWTIDLPDADAVAATSAGVRAAGFDVREHAGAAVAVDPWGTQVRWFVGRGA